MKNNLRSNVIKNYYYLLTTLKPNSKLNHKLTHVQTTRKLQKKGLI
jgi:hypothetical protein